MPSKEGTIMKPIRMLTTTAIIGWGALAFLAAPSFAASNQGATKAHAPVQLAHMSQGQGGTGSGHPCPSGKMEPGYGMGHGSGGQGMMAPRYGMGPQMHQGMMGQGMMGQGKMAPGSRDAVVPIEDLSADDVRHFLEHRLAMQGNKRLKVADVKEADDDKIVADITTVDGSLVERLEVDRHTGQMKQVE
jgi:hypothetical protein